MSAVADVVVSPWALHPHQLGEVTSPFVLYQWHRVWDKQLMPRRGWHTSEYCGPSPDPWAWVQVDQRSRFPKVLLSLWFSKQFLELGEARLKLGLCSGIKEKLENPCAEELEFLVPSPWEFLILLIIIHIWYSNVYWMNKHLCLECIHLC